MQQKNAFKQQKQSFTINFAPVISLVQKSIKSCRCQFFFKIFAKGFCKIYVSLENYWKNIVKISEKWDDTLFKKMNNLFYSEKILLAYFLENNLWCIRRVY